MLFCLSKVEHQLLSNQSFRNTICFVLRDCSTATKKKKRKLIYAKGKTFVDWKRLLVKAGNGGKGSASFVHSRDHRGGPNGGDGGNGGDVIVMADNDYSQFSHLNHSYRAQNGTSGSKKNKHGKNGVDLCIQVPVGTVVSHSQNNTILSDLTHNGETFVVAKGGEKGLGNVRFKSPTNVRPRDCTEGDEGDELFIEFELKSIADIGLVGFPNAGKSSLLHCISRATPKIGNYPFTTLKPNIGVLNLKEDLNVTVADIPGIVEGAHENVGLGHEFLRHVERCHMLMYVMDCSQPDMLHQFQILKKELDLYKPGLSTLSSVFVANKCDLVKDVDKLQNHVQQNVDMPVVAISAKYHRNIQTLKDILLGKWRIQ